MMDTFPYVQECPDCDGTGHRTVTPTGGDTDAFSSSVYAWGETEPIRTVKRYRYIDCETCSGRGKIIPPEWTDDAGT